MCLSKIHERYDKPSNVIVDAWKDFTTISSSKLEFSMRTYKGSKQVPLDTWIKAESGPNILADDGASYEPGFHVWTDDKNISGKRRVYVRQVCVRGTQNWQNVAIAREMYVPSDPDAWPPKGNEPVPPPKGPIDKMKGKFFGKGGSA